MQFKSKKNLQPLLKPEYSVSFLMLELKDNETKGKCTSQSSEDSDFEDDDPLWLVSLGLTERSRKTLVSGGWLSDQHMTAAMSLVKRHFPEIHGLQNPLRNKSQSKPFTPQPEGSIQIHHTSNHWVTSCYLDGEVKLYDFLYCRKDGIPKELEQQLRTVYQKAATKGHIAVTVPAVQQQKGGQDCGLYAIACLFLLALGDKPEQVHFKQDEMRMHLKTCFETETVLPFPHCTKRSRTSHVTVNITV